MGSSNCGANMPVPGVSYRRAASSSQISSCRMPGTIARPAHVTVQPLPDERVLVVGARCHWRAESGAERNAAVYDPDGGLVMEETLGDGIGHVLTTAGGAVWVGYSLGRS